ncbi:MAG: efflux RND transporter periplasmic adaptor subunit [Gammaproteobacteria bacterium]|nr:efflux RND transporter periplasmic adaptor subunit [Gammaproteobacteria bacterium]
MAPSSLTIASDYHSHAHRPPYLMMLAATGFAILLTGCGKGDAATSAGAPQMPAMPVTVIEARTQQVPITIETVGQIEGSKDVEVRARVSGTRTRQAYQEGDQVKAGSTLFTIDREPFEIALAQARATLEQAQADLAQAERESARLKPLIEEKAVSRKEYDTAVTALQTAQAAVTAGDARVRDAELNLSYTNVVAPISGVTGRAQNSLGTLVTAGTDSALLTTMSSIDSVWVRFSFSEEETHQFRKQKNNTAVKLILPDGGMYDVTGKLNFTASTVDTRTGMVQMRAEFANPGQRLLPGQFVRVLVIVGEREAYLVPQAALAQTEQGKLLFLVSPENTVAPRPVETAGWSNHDWVVTQGLAPGDKVIIDNLMKLRPGAPVAPHAPGAAPGAPAATKP